MEKHNGRPIENHMTAAWSNIESRSKLSKISHPSLDQVLEAKEYVDENEK